MFLDPDPRPPKYSAMSGLSPSQPPITPPPDSRPSRRRPLNQRTQSQNNQRRPSRSPEKPTVRLVRPSPIPESPALREYDSGSSSPNVVEYKAGEGNQRAALRDARSGLRAVGSGPGWSYRTSDSPVSDDEGRIGHNPPVEAVQSPSVLQFAPVKAQWQRRSTSSGYNSESSTLKGSDLAFSQKSRKSERLSQGTTVGGTPPPNKPEFRDRAVEDDVPMLSSFPHVLETLPEASPERPTIRAVTPSIASSPSATRPGTGASGPSHARHEPTPSDSRPTSASATVSRTTSRRALSTGSVFSSPLSPLTLTVAQLPAPRPQKSEESILSSEAGISSPSSPNFVAYSPDSVRPRSRSQPLRDVASFDSINSRLQSSYVVQPEEGHRLVTSPSWSSSQSNDTLPSLQLPRRRLRHSSAQPSLASQANSSYGSRGSASPDDFDTWQYRRQGFQSQLSTIASVSDQPSRSASQQLSSFSIGSGVSTIDDGEDRTLSSMWLASQGRELATNALVSEPHSRSGVNSSSGDEPGDMTLGIFREESAKPPPLFTGDSTLGDSTMTAAGTQLFERPSMFPSPVSRDGEGDETFDTLTALQTVSLRQKRSGYSLRQRSNSTPSLGHSRQQSMTSCVESERWSYGSSIFPTWAKHYYGGMAVFSSKVSLHASLFPMDRPPFHSRNSSTWTESSGRVRPETGNSIPETNSVGSSAFPPVFARPKARLGFRTIRPRVSQRSKIASIRASSEPSSAPEPDSRPDSMIILPNPLSSSPFVSDVDNIDIEQHEWSSLREGHASSPLSHQPPPQEHSGHQQLAATSYPRPMTKEQYRHFDFAEPHLAPSRRNAQPRLSIWRPPSFVESLDTLIKSRCNRQILLFGLGFLCPPLWMLGAALPLPKRPMSSEELGQSLAEIGDDEVQAAMVKHEAADTDRRWLEERTFLKARWWRVLNRVMSVVGVLVIGAMIALIVIATTT